MGFNLRQNFLKTLGVVNRFHLACNLLQDNGLTRCSDAVAATCGHCCRVVEKALLEIILLLKFLADLNVALILLQLACGRLAQNYCFLSNAVFRAGWGQSEA